MPQCELTQPILSSQWTAVRAQINTADSGGVMPPLCGDAENDCEMLRLVGVGAAMGNAKPSAKAASDVVVATNDEDGVSEAVRRFVFGETEYE